MGTYTAVTDALFPDFDPVLGHEYVVTITEGDLPGTVQDVCGSYFFVDTADPRNEVVTGDFTINADGTITVVAETAFGETWTSVLTKH